MVAVVVDTKGLKCPLPVLRLRKALRDVPAGEIVEVSATDPGTVGDFQAFCKTSGNEFLEWREDSGVFFFKLKKAA